ncbi:hypothetical protein BGY98DRAFT_933889 [Russula aff. rugulosa BPL654]|nr:hypothetical protein BGY98DRAFT_933889 [Russula aff. rugulosa BPL654]
MIERAIELKDAIDEYLSQYDKDSKLTQNDWQDLERYTSAFEALITKLWQHQRSQTTHIASFEIVEYGIEKLEEYEQETTTVPAYTLSLYNIESRAVQDYDLY